MILLTALCIFLLSFLVSHKTTPRIRTFYIKKRRLDGPGEKKLQTEPVPYGAGLAVFLGFAAPIAIGIFAAFLAWESAPGLLREHAQGIQSKIQPMVAILVGAILMLSLGRVDDRTPLSIPLRFFIQVFVASMVALLGVRLTLFVSSEILQIIITALWLVFVMNVCNFMDNMDGLLPGCALIAALCFALFSGLSGQLFICGFSLALAGAVAGILRYNLHPAQIYLGDEGSLFIGFLLACLSVLASYVSEESDGISWRPFLIPFLLLGMPVIDGVLVIIARIQRRQAPWEGGLDHLSHRLLHQGRSKTEAVRVIWAASVSLGAGGIFLSQTSGSAWITLLIGGGIALSLLRPGDSR